MHQSFIAFLLLLIFLPFFCLIGFFIKFSSKGPVFYKDIRIGKNSTLFYCWKFRTMRTFAEKELLLLLQTSSHAKKKWEKYRKLEKDPRIIPSLLWLRKTHLDELPQLWNILKGEMAFIGPRPVKKEEIDVFRSINPQKTEQMLSVLPGITGFFQISPSPLTLKKRLSLEASYTKGLDLKTQADILKKTILYSLYKPSGC